MAFSYFAGGCLQGAQLRPSGPRLVAFYGCLYFAGMRPEDAGGLTKRNLSLQAEVGE